MAEKEGIEKRLLFYDIGGVVLAATSMYFFFEAVKLAGVKNYIAGIISALIGSAIFSAGIGLIKLSVAARMKS